MTKTTFQSFSSYTITAAITIVLTLFATSFNVCAEEQKVKSQTITVTAIGESHATPDTAIINLAIVTQNKTAQKALAANNKSMNNIISIFKNNGIQENDLYTSGLSIYQTNSNEYSKKNNNDILYHVSNSLTVRIRDLSKTGKIFDQAMALGINAVNGITFTNGNTKPLYQEARKKAVSEAIEKAETIAQAANLKLGPIIKISENDNSYTPTPRLMTIANKSYTDTNFSSGELNYNVSITVTFSIE
ncbi:SIMPL domain-containing protein [Bartonella sp. CB189]|uniref:SIMPL domain-containing protein n=1 Tax=Bartonella sp. CB189 TaxID=3112254 RepID=UPI002F96C6D3